MYESRDANPFYQSADLDFDAARAEWERQGEGATAEVERLRSDAEADRLGTAGLQDYIRRLEGLLRDLEAAWGGFCESESDRQEEAAFLDAVEGVVDEWRRIDPEGQG